MLQPVIANLSRYWLAKHRLVQSLAQLLCAVVVTLSIPGNALAVEPQERDWAAQAKREKPQLYLYTLGAGDSVFESFGHAFLCFEMPSETPCFDYGVFSEEGLEAVVIGTLRGEEKFKIQRVSYNSSVDLARLLDRAIWRQRIVAPQTDVNALYSELNEAASREESYAYHPATNNCATKLRHIIDELSDGDLSRSEASAQRSLSYRERVLRGFRGKVPELLAAEVFLGAASDSVPDAWRASYEPEALRWFIEEELGAPAEVVHQASRASPSNSAVVGRGLLMLAGALLALLVYASARGQGRTARLVVGGLGYMSTLLWLLMGSLYLISPFPEFATNLLLLVLWPTDFFIGHLRGRAAVLYTRLRVIVFSGFLVSDLAGVSEQVVAPSCVFFLLPITFYAFLVRIRPASPF